MGAGSRAAAEMCPERPSETTVRGSKEETRDLGFSGRLPGPHGRKLPGLRPHKAEELCPTIVSVPRAAGT